MKKHISKPSVETKKESFVQKLRGFAKAKPYFVLGLIIAIIAILIFSAQYFTAPQATLSDKAIFAKQIYLDNNSVLGEFRLNLEEEMKNPPVTTLDDDYLYSIKSDLDWLTSKNESIFNSKPNSGVYIKEIAFSLALQKIIELNSTFSIDLGEADYQTEINLAKNTDINTPVLLTLLEMGQYFDNDAERELYSNSLKSIFDEYISLKRILISNSDSMERKYVESKKLILLSQSYDENLA
ncbi:MAG: hypothetical protein WCW13_01510 [archaeon]|jgi:hypothetical protein